jgi:choline dehydrogenase-like flavoprotein
MSPIFPRGATRRTNHERVSQEYYDAVIVGAGISGAIIANELRQAGKRVLVLEAGFGEDLTTRGYDEYLARFYGTAAKDNNSPYPPNPSAGHPRSSEVRKVRVGELEASGHLVQIGPFATDTTYTRVLGGTTLHWEGKTLRMLPEDFELRSRYDQGRDWPISYDQLEPYYRQAEREIGVSADVEDQAYLGMSFPPGYVFPMRGLPPSYLDKMVAKGLGGMTVELDGEQYSLRVRTFPQGRNGVPNPDYDGGKGFVPVGAVSTNQVETGGRCQGNINCVPICPVQAKYNANKTLAKALQSGDVHLLPRSVASKVHVDPLSRRVTHIEYKSYGEDGSSQYTTGKARGHVFILAANAIENARLMLASGLPSSSGLMGRNFMDHAYLLAWALMPEVAGTMRGRLCTSGICDLRGGSFRRRQAGFAIDIHNDGWGWAVGSPYSDLLELVHLGNRFGPQLRRDLVDRITRQLQLAFMIEVLPSESNRICVDPSYRDALGNMRPVVSVHVPGYTMRGVVYARHLARLIFSRLGAEDHTLYVADDYGHVSYEGQSYVIRGGNHLAGTHIMGASSSNSVVDARQRSWDHENLYLIGGGSMASIGTSNITLTIAALCFKSAEHIVEQLERESAPAELAVG